MKSPKLSLSVIVIGAALVGGGIVAAAMGRKTIDSDDSIAAREFRLVDEKGRTRIAFDVQGGCPSIRLLDENGTPEVVIGGSGRNPESPEPQLAGVSVRSKDGQAAVWFGVAMNQVPMMQMLYQGFYIVHVGVSDGSPTIVLLEKEDQPEKGSRVVFKAPSDGREQ